MCRRAAGSGDLCMGAPSEAAGAGAGAGLQAAVAGDGALREQIAGWSHCSQPKHLNCHHSEYDLGGS